METMDNFRESEQARHLLVNLKAQVVININKAETAGDSESLQRFKEQLQQIFDDERRMNESQVCQRIIRDYLKQLKEAEAF